jgi:hypothetical protein
VVKIGEGLSLPTEAITQTFGILAIKGAGKTYLALKLAEEFLKAKLQVIAVDPVGVCWGLRSSADGKAPGLPIVIFGGDHADVPLEKESGSLTADIAVEETLSMVLDLSHFRKGEQVSFMTAFAERLYLKNRNPLHLLLDEADMYAPQRPMPGQQRMLGALEDIVRRGRARGIGVTLVTQRAAVLNKDVLTQVEILMALRTIGKQDRDAVEAWVRAHGTEERRAEMMGSLASLPNGTVWVWSPGWLDIFKRVKVAKRETFDSSRTPKVGEKKIEPRQRAEVDLDELRKRMAATIERAKEEDPRELKKRIAELQRQLRTGPKQTVSVETPCNHGPEIQALKRQNSELKASYQTAMGVIKRIEKVSLDALGKAHETIAGLAASIKERKFPAIAISTPPRVGDIKGERPVLAHPGMAASRNNSDITPPQQKILNALAAFEAIGLEIVAKPAVAAFCRVSSTSGGYFNNLGALRSKGLIIYPNSNQASLTPEGRVHARLSDPISGLADLHAGWLGVITEPQRKILKELIRIYPHDIDKSELAERVEVSPTSGGYFNNLGRLRTLMAIEYPTPGKARASDLLFPDGLR